MGNYICYHIYKAERSIFEYEFNYVNQTNPENLLQDNPADDIVRKLFKQYPNEPYARTDADHVIQSSRGKNLPEQLAKLSLELPEDILYVYAVPEDGLPFVYIIDYGIVRKINTQLTLDTFTDTIIHMTH